MTDPVQVVVTPLAPASTVAVAVADVRPQVQVNPQAVAELAQTFETLAQNVKGLPFVVQRNAQGRLAAVVYAGGLLVKTLQRNSAGQLAAVVLTGTALGQRTLTKQLLRDANGVLTGAAYTQQGAA
jgi:hypothetical protein